MLSYSWSYTIGDIVDTLFEFCSSNKLCPKRTYVWMCCLCINQHRVAAMKKKERSGMVGSGDMDFLVEFSYRVQGIGHVLAMMASWNDPGYLQRIWCVYELYTAHTKRCKISIVMPPKEKLALEETLFGQDEENAVDALFGALAKTKVQNANASVESDRYNILKLVQQYPSFARLNNVVNDLLRTWVRNTIGEAIEKRKTQSSSSEEDRFLLANFYYNVGKVLWANDEEQAALLLAKQALTLFEGLDKTKHDTRVAQCDLHGRLLLSARDYDDALVEYTKALSIQKSAHGKDHPRTGAAYNKIGDVLDCKGEYDAALVAYRRALAINESALGKYHPEAAFSYSNIGHILYKKSNDFDGKRDYDAALLEYRKALAILESAFGKEHPDTAKIYERIGNVLFDKDYHDGALVIFMKAYAVGEYILGKDHPITATSFRHLAQMHMRAAGNLLFVKKNLDGAIVEERKAVDIFSKSAGRKAQMRKFASYNRIGNVLWCKRDYDGALVEFRNAFTSLESALGMNHPEVARFQRYIQEHRRARRP